MLLSFENGIALKAGFGDPALQLGFTVALVS